MKRNAPYYFTHLCFHYKGKEKQAEKEAAHFFATARGIRLFFMISSFKQAKG